ncbi:ABC transporter ATP-binding protein/permease [Actinomycetaceae bacterium TAE3-ERU4]|nr:ABC transporter ATP-binding protein/permease [Actinomycetaceae bacterium TAE3-ERU4]
MKLPVASNRETGKLLVELAKKNKIQVWGTFTLHLLATVTATLLPWITGKTLDWISAGTTARVVSWAITVMVFLVIIRIMATFAAEYFAGVLGENIYQQLRDKVITEVTHLPLSTVERAGSGDLLGRVTYDVRRIQNIITNGFSPILQVVMTLSVTYLAAVITIPSVGWIILLPAPFVFLIMRWFFKRVSPLIQSNAAIVSQVSGQVSENAAAARTIEAQGMVPLRRGHIAQTVRSMWNLQLTVGLTRSVGMSLLNILLMLPLLLAIIAGAIMIPRGITTIGAITTLTMYTLQVRAPFTSAMYWVTNAQVAWASLRRIAGAGLVPPDRQPTEKKPVGRTLELKNVSFSYIPGKPVLDNINLVINPGETIAVVGTSGAGKSTMARLIAGIDTPSAGTVQIGGVSVTEMTEDTLHSQVALVTQEHHVFSATLRENLKLANPAATDFELYSALKDVNATWADELPAGLDSLLGSTGVVLTSAQAQQLALARLVLMNPHTLILDEATSMMDPSNANQLERTLGHVLEGRTVVMIAHRLFTARHADRICVMEGGKIAELGTHDELLAEGGLYSHLWNAWQNAA